MSDVRTAPTGPDPRERFFKHVFRMLNTLARWMISVGIPTGSRNILLTVRGRRSGTPRTIPVSMLEFDGRRFVQASYSTDGWVRNPRAAGEATLTDHGHRVAVQSVELDPDKAGLAATIGVWSRAGRDRAGRCLWRQQHIQVSCSPSDYSDFHGW